MLVHLIGGFLGGGKTTAIQQACRKLKAVGKHVGVITNDQGNQLVDTAFFKDEGISTEEVVGSCFCCNYDALEKHLASLEKQLQPEVIFAESVGSCADLIATIMRPLKRFHPQNQVVLSVFADAQVLPAQVSGSSLFANTVNYIYKKQLEEADILVLSKCDLLSDYQWKSLNRVIADYFSHKTVLFQNSYNEQDIQHWLATASSFLDGERKTLELDYQQYGAGEAELAWLNQRLNIQNKQHTALQAAQLLMENFYRSVQQAGLPIGHLKFGCNSKGVQEKISFTSSSTGEENVMLPNLPVDEVDLLINARVQTTPENLLVLLEEAVEQAKRQTNSSIKKLSSEAFVPGFPKPTYRILDEK